MAGTFVLNQLRRRRPGSRAVMLGRSAAPLHAMITSAGTERRDSADYDWHGLRRGPARFVLLQYTLSGRGRLEYEGRRRLLLPGQCLLLHFPHDNRYWVQPGDRWRFFYVCLHGDQVLRAWYAALKQAGPVLDLSADEPLLTAAAGLCLQVLRQELRGPWHASALAYDLAMRLLERTMPTPGARQHRPAPLQRVLELVQAQPTAPWRVPELARRAGYSRFHFTRLFEQHVGVTPSEYLIRQRLAHAAQQLLTRPLSVQAIAQSCGFADPAYFSRAFRRLYGMTPSAFRGSGMYGAEPT